RGRVGHPALPEAPASGRARLCGRENAGQKRKTPFEQFDVLERRLVSAGWKCGPTLATAAAQGKGTFRSRAQKFFRKNRNTLVTSNLRHSRRIPCKFARRGFL